MKYAVVVVVMIGLGYLAWSQLGGKTATPTPIPTSQASVSPAPESYTLAQVAEHADKNSCWLAIEGKVYDVTPFVSSGFHPGKDAILQGCGKDATELFNTRPMAEKPSAHSRSCRSRGSQKDRSLLQRH